LIQLTIIRIEGYGPWTLTLGSDREGQLQMLQARVYHDLQKIFSDLDCIVFSNRFDEYFAVTNGLSVESHKVALSKLADLYNDLKLSMTIGMGRTAHEANLDAYSARKKGHDSGALLLSFNSRKVADDNDEDRVQIMHIDVDSSTKLSSRLSPYEITSLVAKIYAGLSESFLARDSLTFFLGGDNFMVISNGVTKDDARMVIGKIEAAHGIKLNCGIGTGRTGRKAAAAATEALDTIRHLRNKGNIQSIYEVRCL
jgi:GTP cyclohydrolase IIa